jgi:hypothetical protein
MTVKKSIAFAYYVDGKVSRVFGNTFGALRRYEVVHRL